MRIVTVFLLVVVGSGCASGTMYMSGASEARPLQEMVRIEFSTSANPRAPIRRTFPIPYEVDGVEVPYRWVASGNYQVVLEPGDHRITGLIEVDRYGTEALVPIDGQLSVVAGSYSWEEVARDMVDLALFSPSEAGGDVVQYSGRRGSWDEWLASLPIPECEWDDGERLWRREDNGATCGAGG